MTIKGPDLSSHNDSLGRPNFADIKAAGYEFVIIKATEGNTYTNPYLNEDFHAARAAGLKVGVYHFMRSNVDGIAQANYFVDQIGKVGKPDLPVAIDFETNDHQAFRLCHERLDQVRTVIRQHGYRTMTYSNEPFLRETIPVSCKFCGSDPLWLAAYGDKSVPPVSAPWSKPHLWQYTDAEKVPGLSGGTDVSEYLFTDWAVFVGGKPTPEVPSWWKRDLEYPPSGLKDPGVVKSSKGGTFQYGPDVATVQRKLSITPDSLYGPTTVAHVKGFQQAHGLVADGVVGAHTATVMGP